MRYSGKEKEYQANIESLQFKLEKLKSQVDSERSLKEQYIIKYENS
jgi:hypothetical protein